MDLKFFMYCNSLLNHKAVDDEYLKIAFINYKNM